MAHGWHALHRRGHRGPDKGSNVSGHPGYQAWRKWPHNCVRLTPKSAPSSLRSSHFRDSEDTGGGGLWERGPRNQQQQHGGKRQHELLSVTFKAPRPSPVSFPPRWFIVPRPWSCLWSGYPSGPSSTVCERPGGSHPTEPDSTPNTHRHVHAAAHRRRLGWRGQALHVPGLHLRCRLPGGRRMASPVLPLGDLRL